MKNSDYLLISANLIAHLLVSLTHLMTALNTLHHFNVVFTPQRQGIFCLALWTNRTGYKAFTHTVSCRR